MTATITGAGRRSSGRSSSRRATADGSLAGTAGPRPASPCPTAGTRSRSVPADAAGNDGAAVHGRRSTSTAPSRRSPARRPCSTRRTRTRSPGRATASFTPAGAAPPSTIRVARRVGRRGPHRPTRTGRSRPARRRWAWNGKVAGGAWAPPRHVPDRRHGDERHPGREPVGHGARPTRSASRPRCRRRPRQGLHR